MVSRDEVEPLVMASCVRIYSHVEVILHISHLDGHIQVPTLKLRFEL